MRTALECVLTFALGCIVGLVAVACHTAALVRMGIR